MEQYLCKSTISPDSIGFSAGAAATIEASSFLLADAEDVVVIPAPSYPMYTNDLGVKCGLIRYDLQTHYELDERAWFYLSTEYQLHLEERVWADLNNVKG
jgi:aspartate/methionine/tyrosine aminotransferase